MHKSMLLLLCFLLLSPSAVAVDAEKAQADALQTESLLEMIPDEARDLLGDVRPESHADAGLSAGRIFRSALSLCTQDLHAASGVCFRILCVVLLCASAASVCPEEAKRPLCCVCALGITAACAGEFGSMIRAGTDVIDELSVFSKVLLPVIAGAAAASGAALSSAAVCSAAALLSQRMLSFLSGTLVPLLYAYLALSAAEAAGGGQMAGGPARTIASFVKKALRVMLFLFSAYLSLTRVISGKADAVALKAAKMTVSSVVPVIGTMLADASETVLVSASMLQQSVGVFGLLAALAILILPFLRIGIRYLLLRLTETVCTAFGVPELTKQLSAAAGAMGFLTAMTGTAGLMVFISCVCFLKVGVS